MFSLIFPVAQFTTVVGTVCFCNFLLCCYIILYSHHLAIYSNMVTNNKPNQYDNAAKQIMKASFVKFLLYWDYFFYITNADYFIKCDFKISHNWIVSCKC